MKTAIGEIIKAQGIRGEVKVKPLVRDSLLFKRFKTLLLETVPFKVSSCSVRQGFVFILFENVPDRNAAEALVGKTIYVDSESLPKLKDGEFYINELLDVKLYFENDELVGTIESVENYGSADIFTIKGEKTVRIPFLKKLNFMLNKSLGYAVVDKSAFLEVAVYED